MRRILLALLGAAIAAPASAEEAANIRKLLEERIRSNTIIEEMVPERFDTNRSELVIWYLHTAGDIRYCIKSEERRIFEKGKRDGKTPLFDFRRTFISGASIEKVLGVYALDGEMPVEVYSTTLEKAQIPERMSVSANVIVPRSHNRIQLQPYYIAEVQIHPLSYDHAKGILILEIPKLGHKEQTRELKLEDNGKAVDFSVCNYERRGLKLIEIVKDFNIRGDGSLELRVISEREVPDSEIEDYKASLNYKLVPMADAGLKFRGNPIKTFVYKKKIIELETETEKAAYGLRLPQHYGRGVLPDFMLRDSRGNKYYGRVDTETREVWLFTDREGKVEFSKDLDKSIPVLLLPEKPIKRQRQRRDYLQPTLT